MNFDSASSTPTNVAATQPAAAVSVSLAVTVSSLPLLGVHYAQPMMEVSATAGSSFGGTASGANLEAFILALEM